MIFRERASTVCVQDGKMLAVILEDPATGRRERYLPGGALEAEETPGEAAARETLEETGYAVLVDESTGRRLRYPFVWGGVSYDCVTHFFFARLVSPLSDPLAVDDSTENKGIEWVTIDDIPKALGYHQGILSEVLALLPGGLAMTPPRLQSFAEFWPFYVCEHANATNRLLHVIGTLLAIVIAVLSFQRPWLLPLVPIAGYGFAWFGHFGVQGNRPATFQYPLWSFIGDFKMLAFTLTGRMGKEVESAMASKGRTY